MNRTLALEVGGESVTTLPPWPPNFSLNKHVYDKLYKADHILKFELEPTHNGQKIKSE